ncbi:MAG: hypothetical protein FIA94_14595 [Nitrospirae bacterium]|nr:hypothetical protein [Nitrospirota bacterium]
MKKANKQMLYTVTVGEGCCCGPAFGPSSARELFEIAAEKGPGSVILQIEEPIAYNNELISYIVVTPRYIGDTLKMLRKNGCIVDIARVLPDQLDQLRKGKVDGSAEYLAVGECRPG